MPSIVVVTPEYQLEGGGLAGSARRIVQLLRELGWQVTVILSFGAEVPEGCDYALEATWRVEEGGYRPELARALRVRLATKELTRILEAVRPAWCLAFSGGLNGALVAWACRSTGTPMLLAFRGSEIHLAPTEPELVLANRESLAVAERVIACSSEMLVVAAQLVPELQLEGHVVPNPVAGLAAVTARPPLPPTLGVGATHLNEKKGVGIAIRVLGELVRGWPQLDWRLELAGGIDADLAENYRALARQERVLERITWLGSVDRERFRARLALWGMALQLSPGEGFCNLLVEAMQAAVPVMFTGTGFVAECLGAEFPDLVLPFGPVRTIAERVASAWADPTALHARSTQARQALAPSVEPLTVADAWSRCLVARAALPAATNLVATPLVPTVILHDVAANPEFTSLDMPLAAFVSFLDEVRKAGWRLCSAAEYFRLRAPHGCMIATFDDAYLGVLEHAFPEMRRRGFTGTVFVPTAHVGADNSWNPKDGRPRRHMDWAQLQELERAGWEIGGHGHRHVNLRRLGVEALEQEIASCAAQLRAHFLAPETFAYPYGDWSPTVARVVAGHFARAFTVHQGGGHRELDGYALRRYSPEEALRLIGARAPTPAFAR